MASRRQFTAEEVSLLLDESLAELEQECPSEADEDLVGDSEDEEDSRVAGMLASAYFGEPSTDVATTPAERFSSSSGS